MDELKQLFGDKALTFEQLSGKLSESNIKLGNLAGGAYIGADKFKRLEAERDALSGKLADYDPGWRDKLSEAQNQLEGYDPEWRLKLEQAEARTQALKNEFAADAVTDGLRFSSESARRAFSAALKERALSADGGGRPDGFDEFLSEYRKNDPGAFLDGAETPVFASSASGPLRRPESRSDQINHAIRELLAGI